MREYIVIDVDTQEDFLLAEGTRCIRNHRRVLMNIRRMMAWVKFNNIPVISTSRIFPDEIDERKGLEKISYTLLNHRLSFRATSKMDLRRDLLRKYQQIIFQKRCEDPFREPLIDRMLSEVRADKFIIIGVNFGNAVSLTALGLLQRGKNVRIIVDAFGAYGAGEKELEFPKLKEKGAKLIETRRLAGVSSLRQVGTCSCERCKGKLIVTV